MQQSFGAFLFSLMVDHMEIVENAAGDDVAIHTQEPATIIVAEDHDTFLPVGSGISGLGEGITSHVTGTCSDFSLIQLRVEAGESLYPQSAAFVVRFQRDGFKLTLRVPRNAQNALVSCALQSGSATASQPRYASASAAVS